MFTVAMLCSQKLETALSGVAQWLGIILPTKGLLVQFPVRAHVEVAGQAPRLGA